MSDELVKEQMILSLSQFQRYINNNITVFLTNQSMMNVFQGEFYTILRRNLRGLTVGLTELSISAKNIDVKFDYLGKISYLNFTIVYGGFCGVETKNQLILLNEILKEIKPNWSHLHFEATVDTLITDISKFKIA